MNYDIIILFLALLVAEAIYMVVARRYIPAAVTDTISVTGHRCVTGAGVLFMPVLFAIFYSLDWLDGYEGWLFLLPGIALWIVSYIDDLRPLSALLRLAVQVIAAVVVCSPIFIFAPWLAITVVAVVVLLINSYNFMDGIRGMLGFYSIVVTESLMLVVMTGDAITPLAIPTILAMLICALVLLVYNVLLRDEMFAGDVGSVFFGFYTGAILAYIIALNSFDFSYLTLVSVFIVDTLYTLALRIIRRENILLPHREHLYQRLARRTGHPMWISIAYAVLQSVVSIIFLLFTGPTPILEKWKVAVCVFMLLIALRAGLQCVKPVRE